MSIPFSIIDETTIIKDKKIAPALVWRPDWYYSHLTSLPSIEFIVSQKYEKSRAFFADVKI